MVFFQRPTIANKVFVGGVHGVAEEELRMCFASFGTVLSVQIVVDHQTGWPRGFGFVTFTDAFSAQQAIQAGRWCSASGAQVTVKPAWPRTQNPRHGSMAHQLPKHVHMPCNKQYAQQAPQPGHDTGGSKPHRHTKQQQSSTACAKATASAFLDIIHQAPRLLELLAADSLKALAATSRNLREVVHCQVTVISLKHEEDIAWLIKGSWPHLSMVILRDQEYAYSRFSALLSHKWRLRARVNLSLRSFGAVDVALLIEPLQHPQLRASDSYQLFVKPLKRLLHGEWSRLKRLDVSDIKPGALGAAVLAELNQGDWPLLSSLELNDNQLDAKSISELIKGNWTALESLDLSSNKLDTEAMEQLVKGNWPALKYLWLSINPLLDGTAISQLSRAKWPQLHDLSLSYTRVTVEMMEQLVKLPLPKLRTLSLSGSGLDEAVVAVLSKGQWPALRSLRLTENDISATAMAHLAGAHFPMLRLLDLSSSRLDTVAVQWLVQGHFPMLEDLDLSYNKLDDGAIRCLVSGQWLSLTNLSLNQNQFGVQGVQELTKGEWPMLRFLCLDIEVLNQANAIMLGVNLGQLQDFESQKARTDSSVVQVSRDCIAALKTGSILWPRLTHVLVI